MIAPGQTHWAYIVCAPEDRQQGERFRRKLASILIAPCFRSPEFFGGARPGRRLRPFFFEILTPPSDSVANLGRRKRLEASRFLILLASPSMARLKAAENLAESLHAIGRREDALAVILGDESSAASLGEIAQNCLPPALRYPLPSLIDARPEAGGVSEAAFHVLAEIAGTAPENFVHEHNRFRFRQRLALAGVAIALTAAVSFGYARRMRKAPSPIPPAGAGDASRTTPPRSIMAAAKFEPGAEWLTAAREAARWGRRPDGALLAARALGFRGYGIERLSRRSPENHARFVEAYPDLLSPERREELQRELADLIEAAGAFGLPYWCGPAVEKTPRRLAAVAFSPDGTRLACGSAGGLVAVHNLRREGGFVRLYSEPAGVAVTALAFSPDGARLGVVGGRDTIVLGNLREKTIERTFGNFGGPVSSVAFHPNGRKMAAGGAAAPDHRGRGTAHLWSLEDSMGLAIPCETPINVVAFSADGKRLLAGGESLEIFDAATGRLLQRRKGPPGGIRAIAESPDGRRLAAGGGTTEGAAFVLWDSDGNETQIRPPDVPARVTSLRFSSDSRTLIAGHTDGFIRIYRLPTGDISAIIAAHRGPINALDLSPDGRSLATVGEDGTARLWNFSESRRSGPSSPNADAESQNTDLVAYVATGWYAVDDPPPRVTVGVPTIRGFFNVPAESHVGILHVAPPGEEDRRLFEHYLRCSAYNAALALLETEPKAELDAVPLARHAAELGRRFDGGGTAPLFFARLARTSWGQIHLASEEAIARLPLDAEERQILIRMRTVAADP